MNIIEQLNFLINSVGNKFSLFRDKDGYLVIETGLIKYICVGDLTEYDIYKCSILHEAERLLKERK